MSDRTQEVEAQLSAFEEHYQYDATYLKELLRVHPEAYEAFSQFTAMANYRKVLTVEAHFVAKIATSVTEDCGPCTQLGVRKAREAGVSPEIIRGALQREGATLPDDLEVLRKYAVGVATNSLEDGHLEKVRDYVGEEGLAELSLCIASVRVYPCMKRALGYAGKSCELIDVEA